MSIKMMQGFDVRSTESIDKRLTLTKAEMLAVNPNTMPDKYICVCKDDGKFYIYDKSITTPSTETGCFVEYSEKLDLPNAIIKSMQTQAGKEALEGAVSTTLPGAITKSMESSTTKEAMATAVAQTLPDAMKSALEDETLGEKLVNNMFDNEQFSLNVNNKIEFKVDEAISTIEAIDGMD